MADKPDMSTLRAHLDDLETRINSARQSLAQHGIGGKELDAELEKMRTAQTSLRDKIGTQGGSVADATVAADVENLRNAFERWIVSNEHRFSGASHKPR
jgi:septal ring factor EnvC (AmiA/AmiB activator)